MAVIKRSLGKRVSGRLRAKGEDDWGAVTQEGKHG